MDKDIRRYRNKGRNTHNMTADLNSKTAWEISDLDIYLSKATHAITSTADYDKARGMKVP